MLMIILCVHVRSVNAPTLEYFNLKQKYLEICGPSA